MKTNDLNTTQETPANPEAVNLDEMKLKDLITFYHKLNATYMDGTMTLKGSKLFVRVQATIKEIYQSRDRETHSFLKE